MRVVLGLTSRNLRLFFRDPMNVFFSLLSALIVFLLYALFLGNLQVLQIEGTVPGVDPDAITGFVDSWMLAAVVALTTITTPLGALAVFVEDSASGRFRDFLVSPIRRTQLVSGYIGAAFAVGVILSVVVFAVALAYLALLSGATLGAVELLRSVLWILLSTAAFTALWAFVVSFVGSTGAFSALSTIVGTVGGFIAGAYLAMGLLPDAVRDVISALPFAQSAMLFRQEFAAEPLDELVGGSAEFSTELSDFYGITLSVGDWAVPVWFAAVVLGAMAVVFFALAASRIRSRIR